MTGDSARRASCRKLISSAHSSFIRRIPDTRTRTVEVRWQSSTPDRRIALAGDREVLLNSSVVRKLAPKTTNVRNFVALCASRLAFRHATDTVRTRPRTKESRAALLELPPT